MLHSLLSARLCSECSRLPSQRWTRTPGGYVTGRFRGALRALLGGHPPRRDQAVGAARDAAPVVAGAVEAAERAGFDAKRVDPLHRHCAVIRLAGVMAVDAASPLPFRLRL